MAKKKEKSKDSKSSNGDKAKGSKPADAVIGAIEQAFAAAAGGAAQTRGRAADLVEDITSATNRVRETLDDLRVLEDLKGLRAEVETLATRVAALEVQQAAQAEPAEKPATRRSSPRSTSTSTPRASTGTKPAGTRAAKGTSSRSRSTSPGTRATRTTTKAPEAPPVDPAPDASAGRS